MTRAFVACIALLASAPAHAEDCQRGLSGPELAIRESTLDLSLGTCAQTRLSTRLRADATIDIPEFYGTLGSALHLLYEHRLSQHLALNLGARLVDYRFAQNAVLTSDELSSGPVYAGLALPFEWTKSATVTPRLRLIVPGDTGSDSMQLAAALSVPASLRLGKHWSLQARVYGLWEARFTADERSDRWALGTSLGTSWQALSWLGLGAGIAGQAGYHKGGIDHLAPQAHLRIPWSSRSSFDLNLALPSLLLGEERNDAVLNLGLTLGY